MNPQDPKYEQKLKSIASPEQNYFAHFAMRYPVNLSFVEITPFRLESKSCKGFFKFSTNEGKRNYNRSFDL